MTLIDVLLALVLAVGIVASGMGLINGTAETVKQQNKLAVYAVSVPELRATVSQLIEQATRVRVFDTASNARATVDTGTALSGPAIRLEFSSGNAVPTGNSTWQATMEFRSGMLVYRNQNGAEWNITAADGAFVIEDGVLSINVTKGGVAANVAFAVN